MNINRTNLTDLIGKQFKRNKYGLSIWTDEITFVGYVSRIIDREKREIVVYVVGSNSDMHFDIDEIVIVNQKLHWFEEAQMQKREMIEEIREKYKDKE